MGLVQIRKHNEQQWTDALTSPYQNAFKKFYTHKKSNGFGSLN
jgi:hypothetical protein